MSTVGAWLAYFAMLWQWIQSSFQLLRRYAARIQSSFHSKIPYLQHHFYNMDKAFCTRHMNDIRRKVTCESILQWLALFWPLRLHYVHQPPLYAAWLVVLPRLDSYSVFDHKRSLSGTWAGFLSSSSGFRRLILSGIRGECCSSRASDGMLRTWIIRGDGESADGTEDSARHKNSEGHDAEELTCLGILSPFIRSATKRNGFCTIFRRRPWRDETVGETAGHTLPYARAHFTNCEVKEQSITSSSIIDEKIDA